MNLTRLLSGDSGSTALAAQLARARARAAEIEKQIARITDPLFADPDAAPLSFTRKARELETQLESERNAVDALEYELAATANRGTPAVSDAWAELVDGVEALDYDARTKARQLVALAELSSTTAGCSPTKATLGRSTCC